jgi:hypothetical protein
VELRFYHSLDQILSADDVLVQTVPLAGLLAGAEASAKLKGETNSVANIPLGGRIFALFVEGGFVHDVVSPSL